MVGRIDRIDRLPTAESSLRTTRPENPDRRRMPTRVCSFPSMRWRLAKNGDTDADQLAFYNLERTTIGDHARAAIAQLQEAAMKVEEVAAKSRQEIRTQTRLPLPLLRLPQSLSRNREALYTQYSATKPNELSQPDRQRMLRKKSSTKNLGDAFASPFVLC